MNQAHRRWLAIAICLMGAALFIAGLRRSSYTPASTTVRRSVVRKGSVTSTTTVTGQHIVLSLWAVLPVLGVASYAAFKIVRRAQSKSRRFNHAQVPVENDPDVWPPAPKAAPPAA